MVGFFFFLNWNKTLIVVVQSKLVFVLEWIICWSNWIFGILFKRINEYFMAFLVNQHILRLVLVFISYLSLLPILVGIRVRFVHDRDEFLCMKFNVRSFVSRRNPFYSFQLVKCGRIFKFRLQWSHNLQRRYWRICGFE